MDPNTFSGNTRLILVIYIKSVLPFVTEDGNSKEKVCFIWLRASSTRVDICLVYMFFSRLELESEVFLPVSNVFAVYWNWS